MTCIEGLRSSNILRRNEHTLQQQELHYYSKLVITLQLDATDFITSQPICAGVSVWFFEWDSPHFYADQSFSPVETMI